MFLNHFVCKKIKNCKASQFCKISFIVFIFDRFLCQRRFLQGLQWVLMGFSVYSAKFLVASGGFLLCFLRKRNTPTFMRNIAIEPIIKFSCVCKLDCKSFLRAFGHKGRKCCLRRWQWKRKDFLRLPLGHKTNFEYRLLIYFRQSSFLKSLFSKGSINLLLKMLINFLTRPT